MISVVTVCRNEEDEIDDTISSVYSQTWGDFEYIVKDGASEDSTMEKILSWKKKFAGRGIDFKVLSAPDCGIYDAMNIAVKESEGEWVIFINAGDSFAGPRVMEKVFSERDTAGTDLIYGQAAQEEFGKYYYYRNCPERIEERMPFSHQSVFARRKLLSAFPFDLRYPIGADYHFLLRASRSGCVFRDSGVLVARISKTGVSSVKLKDTFMESVRIRREMGIDVKVGKWELFMLELKQFGMDHFPTDVKKLIRNIQRSRRNQKEVDFDEEFAGN